MELLRAASIAEHWSGRLAAYCDRIKVAGSIRRKRPEVGDIEIVCIPKMVTVLDGLFGTKKIRHPGFAEALKGAVILKGDPSAGKYMQFNLPEGIKLDLFTTTRENWGFIYAIRTGSSEFSQFLAKRWVSRGYRGIIGNLCRDGVSVPTPTEKSLFDLLGLDVVPPEKRNQGGLPYNLPEVKV